MAALDARHIDEACRAANQNAAREGQFWNRLKAAFGDGPRAIGNAFAALKVRPNGGVLLKALELIKRRQERVLVVQVHHIADRHIVIAEMVHEAAAAGVHVQRPAGGVLSQTGLVVLWWNLPQLFDPDAVLLRLAVLGQVEFVDQHLGQRPAHAFADKDIFAVQFHTGLIVGFLDAILADADDPDDHALDRAILAEDQIGGGKTGIDLNAKLFGLGGEPAGNIGQRADIAAVIVHEGRQGEHGQGKLTLRAQHEKLVMGYRCFQRRAHRLPVWEQLRQGLRIQHSTRQDVSPDLGALFQKGDRNFSASLCGQLFQTDRGRQARRATADDNDVIFHGLAFEFFTHDLIP